MKNLLGNIEIKKDIIHSTKEPAENSNTNKELEKKGGGAECFHRHLGLTNT